MTKTNVSAKLNWGFSDHRVYLFRGWLLLLVGALFLTMTALAPNVQMFLGDNSWLPFIGIFLIIVGILRFIDAILAPRSPRFHLNLQGGIFDQVVGLLVLCGVGHEAILLYNLIACYLITQGLVRLIASFYITFKNPVASRIVGSLSLLVGIFVWAQWPTSAAWFLSFALSIEIALRGASLLLLVDALEDESD